MHDEKRNLIPTADLPAWLDARATGWRRQDKLSLGFGEGNDQYRLFEYPGPADDETMGLFCEWHTEDYFDVSTGPHVAIGLRGPADWDPHRGRGLAIGILSGEAFEGCPPAPGGPAMFIEDFTINEGTAAISEWQLSRGVALPGLVGNSVYRLDMRVSIGQVWAGVWQVLNKAATGVEDYHFLGQASCSKLCPEADEDRGVGNAFIGTGFSDPSTRSWMENIHIAHWKTGALSMIQS